MTSEVYFSNFRARSDKENKITKLKKIFSGAGFDSLISNDDITAIKVHFGEEGNDTFLSPVLVRQVVDRVRKNGGNPFLTDTATLYNGQRRNAVNHLKTAISHGFDFAVVNAPLIIADGLYGNDYVEVPISKGHFEKVKIARAITEADSMIVLSHFKGHCSTGFGGAIKNLGMGCAPPAGKFEQHCAKAIVNEELCICCGECAKACELDAIELKGGKSHVDKTKCIACGSCVGACPEGAINFDWEHEIPVFIEKMVEYAYGAVAGKEDKVGYINFVMNVTPDCDCAPYSDAPIVPDVGILASRDPVALDMVCYDLVNKQSGIANSMLWENLKEGEDKFRGTWGQVDSTVQLRYGEKIGLGKTKYKLIEL